MTGYDVFSGSGGEYGHNCKDEEEELDFYQSNIFPGGLNNYVNNFTSGFGPQSQIPKGTGGHHLHNSGNIDI